MPLVAHNPLPSFGRLATEGSTVLAHENALQQDIRELHIGLLNMMPDAALEATERQFFRLVGQSNQIAQFYVHPFSLPELDRSAQTKAHIDTFYSTFEEVKQQGLDALIVTGANVVGPDLTQQAFWQPLQEVIDWAYENVTSTLCSCLATHAVMLARYGQERRPLGFKRWGVYPHRVLDRGHPLVSGVNTRFDVPHSRFNQIDRAQFEDSGLQVLASGDEADVHLGVSPDGFRLVFFQGHPEYDAVSLMKEYKREVGRFATEERKDYPPVPSNYFGLQAQAILDEYQARLIQALEKNIEPPSFPDHLIGPQLDNTWHDSAEAIINNWIGLVYQLTHVDRAKPFRDDVDPANPLDALK